MRTLFLGRRYCVVLCAELDVPVPGLGRIIVACVAVPKGTAIVLVAVTTGITGSGRVVERGWVGVDVVGIRLAVVAITKRAASSDGVGEGLCWVLAIRVATVEAIGGGT